MTGKLMQIIRENQDAIYAAAIEQVRQRWPHYAQAPEEALRRSWAAILEALADFWERGDEAKALAWGEMRAHLSANLGFPAAEVLGGLDLLPGLIRPHLERELPRKADLLAALAQLEEGVALLRRAYLEAHFAMHQRRLAWLHELSVAVSAERDPERVLERILAAARELAGARYAALAVYQDERLARFIPLGLSEEEVHAIGDLPTGRGLLGALTEERRTLRLRDLTEHPRFSGFPPHHPEMHSFLGVPILIRDRVYGLLYLTEKEGANTFSEDDQRLVEMLAAHSAVAIENARLYQQSQQAAHDQAALNQVLQVASSTLELEPLLEGVAHAAAEALDTTRSVVLLGGPEAERLRVAGGYDSRFPDQVMTGMEVTRETMPDLWETLRTRQPRLIRDVRTQVRDEALRANLERLEITSTLHVPIVVRDEAVGVLALAESRAAYPFGERHVRLAQAIADQAALAIENARLYQDVQRSAVSRGLVGQMLRDLQAVGGLSEGAMFRAGQELANRVAAEALPGFLEAFTAMGLGALTLVSPEPSRRAEADEEQRRWTFHGDGLVESQVGSDRPTGNYTRGFLCGAVSRVLEGAQVAGVETACQSMGDEMCEFVVQAVG